jgi:alkanesulfonate monooxygenase SsuD/methylene tetrahydromethanopterin reductase-like flavin-dependent oxidoreductase (luciferase family)
MSTLHLALALGGDHPDPTDRWSLLAREAEVGLLDLVTLDVPLDVPAESTSDELGSGLDAVRAATRLAATTRAVGLLPTVHAGRSEPWAIARAVQELDAATNGRAGVHLRVPVPADEQGWVQAVRRGWAASTGTASNSTASNSTASTSTASTSTASTSAGLRPGPVVALPARVGRGRRALPADAADIGFVAPRTAVEAQQLVAAARRAGAPRHLLGDLVVVIDDDAARAHERWERSAGRAPSTAPDGARVFLGTPGQLADLALGWRAAGLCGLRLHPVDPARDVRGATRGLVPELQRRGAFRRSYRSTDLRRRLGEPAAEATARSTEHCTAA